jgi:plasmid stabilization system protein ParE
VKPCHVRFTATAQEHVRREKNWWLENRIHTEIFAAELEEALRIVAALPGAGTLYLYPDVPGLRRVYLRKVVCHLYYTFDEHEVIVRALWGARRDRGPLIEPLA